MLEESKLNLLGDLDTFFSIFAIVQGIFRGRCVASQEVAKLEVLQLYDGEPSEPAIPVRPAGQVATGANINLRRYKKEEYQVGPDLKNNIENLGRWKEELQKWLKNRKT